jgi:hypothetical protein
VNKLSRLLIALASLLLVGVYAVPLWKIQLVAPQYPEGLGMYIGVSSVRGATENDLQNINGLNHYIGMKKIDADAIPELHYMPFILGALILCGLGVAAIGKRKVLYAWLLIFASAGIAGMADFWRWGYDYGHDLNADAAIIMPGMTYQPPLIGSKQILNITASSWPAAGSYLLGASIILGAFAAAVAWRQSRLGLSASAPEAVGSGVDAYAV